MTRTEGKSVPLIFMIPSVAMPCEKAMESLSRSLTEAGLATFRFSLSEGWKASDIPEMLVKALSHPDLKGSHVAFLGFAEGADYIAKNFYDLYSIRFPYACVLLSPSVLALHLNNITCPYLILHGHQDPLFQSVPYKEIQDAVHHHQMRYGDLTTNFVYPDLGKNLGGELFDERVLHQIPTWLVPASIQGPRPQEPLGGTAA